MTYRALLPVLDQWFRESTARVAPVDVPCRSGCSACCHGPFDISPADARLVATAVARLDDATRAGVLDRAASQCARYQELLPAWGPPWDVTDLGDEAFDALVEALADLPCPALDATGACLIYADRPATCRLIGLPIINEDGDVLGNPCPIKEQFPAYAALEPIPLDLQWFEQEAEGHDDLAMDEGWGVTTVAGAVSRES